MTRIPVYHRPPPALQSIHETTRFQAIHETAQLQVIHPGAGELDEATLRRALSEIVEPRQMLRTLPNRDGDAGQTAPASAPDPSLRTGPSSRSLHLGPSVSSLRLDPLDPSLRLDLANSPVRPSAETQ
jgi:hypothetical protein